MTREEVIQLAREAGFDEWWKSGNEQREVIDEVLSAFAAIVSAREREECAKVCDDMALYTGVDCAAAIRARSA